jgi:hypothetical protein
MDEAGFKIYRTVEIEMIEWDVLDITQGRDNACMVRCWIGLTQKATNQFQEI